MIEIQATHRKTGSRVHGELAGGTAEARMPERRCLVSGEVRPKSELLRFVVGPDGTLVYDLEGRLPGRGLWLLPSRTMLERAARRQLFQRAARQTVDVPADLATQVTAQLRRRCIDTLGLAKRAGLAVAGFEKVRARLRAGDAGVLLAASDGGKDGRRKLANLAAAAAPDAAVLSLLSAEEMGAALGRSPCVHAAVARGRLADRFLTTAGVLAAFEDSDADAEPPGGRRHQDPRSVRVAARVKKSAGIRNER